MKQTYASGFKPSVTVTSHRTMGIANPLKRLLLMTLLLIAFVGGTRAQQGLPYEYGFEDNDLAAAGWTTINESSANASEFGINSVAKRTDNYGFRFSSYRSDVSYNQYLISPELSAASGVVVQFYYKSYTNTTETFKVGYSTTNADIASFTFGNEISTNSATWTLSEEFYFPAGTKYVAVYYYSEYQYRLYLDDFSFVAPPSCITPNSIVPTLNGQSITVTWNGNAESYDIAISTDPNANPEDAIDGTASTTSYTKDGLTIDTDYNLWLRGNCSSTEHSEWAGPLSFHIGYCQPTTSSRDNKGITGVSFGMGTDVVNNYDTTNGLPASAPYYGNYFSMVGVVQAGIATPVTITTATGSYPYGIVIWVDLDNNSSFTEDEIMYMGQCSQGNETFEATITIPQTQLLGDYRMRIGGADTAFDSYINGSSTTAPNPCYTGAYAVFHDYTVRVIEAPSCIPPTGLVVSYTGDDTAELSWTGNADSYDIDVNGEIINVKSNTYTLEKLSLGRTYEVKVRANCSETDHSDWSNAVSFKTNDCMDVDMCYITYEVKVKSGYEQYGWYGASLMVKDADTDELLDTWTVPQNASNGTVTGSLAVCPNKKLSFQWSASSYDSQLIGDILVLDANGEEIINTTGALTAAVNYVVDCTTSEFKKPTNFVVSEVGAYSAVLSWTEKGSATAWVIELTNNDEGETTFIDATTNPFTLTNLESETEYFVRVRPAGENTKWSNGVLFSTFFPVPADVAVNNITCNSATITWTGEADKYNLRYKETTPPAIATVILTVGDVWNDGSGYQMLLDADATAYETAFDSSSGWNISDYSDFEYTIPTNAEFNYNTTAFVINNSVSIQIPAGTYDWYITNPSPDYNYIYIASNNGNVGGKADDYVFESGKTYEFVPSLYGNNDGVDVTITETAGARALAPVLDEWVVVNNATSPYTINDLNEAAYYQVEVQGVYADGTSEWVGKNFATLSSNPIPTNVAVTPTHTSATISWNGGSDSYELKYRTASAENKVFFEDFESGIGSWTTSNLQSGGGIKSGAGTDNSNGFAFKWTTNTPQYLISPELSGVAEGNKLKFSYANFNSSYPESFKVGYSTSGNDVENDFTWSDETTIGADTNWHIYELALPADTKYFSVQCTSYDKYYLYVDNFEINGDLIPAGDWASVSTDETSVELTGLEMDTEYEFQIFGIKNGNPNNGTAIASFTTLSPENDKIFTTAGDWDVAENWYPVGVPSEKCKNATIKAAVTIPSGVVATAKNVTIDGGSITIKDGGQLVHYNEGVIATVEKNITGYGTNENGNYYLITTPLKNGIDPANVTNMLTGNYDLYAFDFTQDCQEWRNYKAETFTLAQANAYLYANSEDVTLSFTGELLSLPSPGYVTYINSNSLSYTTAAHPFKNWNLTGNPFASDAFISLGNYSSSSGLSLVSNPEFYTMNNAGDAITIAPDLTTVTGSVFVISKASTNFALGSYEQYQTNSATSVPFMALPVHGETTHQSAVPVVTLADNATTNSSIIESLNGKSASVKLDGRTLYKDDQWNTICLPFNVTLSGSPLEGATAKTLDDATMDGTTVTLTFGDAVTALQANVPYIIKWDTASENIVNPVFPYVTIVNGDNTARTIEEADGNVKFIGYYDAFGITAADENIYYMTVDSEKGSVLKHTGNNRTLNALRAYFEFSENISGGARQFVLNFGDGEDDTTTGINDVERGQNVENGDWYTVDGVKYDKQPTRKGLYINNGRKVVVK